MKGRALYIQLLTRYLVPQAGKAGLLAFCLFASIGLQLYIPQLVRAFIDLASSGGQGLNRIALTFLALALANQLLSAASTYLSADVGWRATNLLRADLFRHVLGLDMAWHKDRTPGEMIERIDGDVTSVSNFFSQFVVRVSAALFLTAGVLALLWREQWRVGLALTVFTFVAASVLHRRREIAVAPTREEREMSAQLFGFIEERLTGLDDIRANGAGRYVMHRFLDIQRQWFAKALRAWWLRSAIWLSMGILFASGYVLTLGLGIGLYLGGAATLGTVYLFFNYMSMLEAPLDQITQQLQEFQRAAAGLRRVRELLGAERTVRDGSRLLAARRGHRVEFENVRFRYREQEVLKGIRFRLEPGETLGLLGRTGSGKTTLIRLLFRLYDATEGRVLVDGIDLKEMRIEDLRQRVGLVTQDVQLFHGTVRENLTFFDSRIPGGRILEVVDQLGIRSWLEKLPEGLDTPLQASGSGLSAGESQLLAFARIFLKDPGLVILDEPSSRLDPATERLLNNAVDRLLEGRTGILIAHRLETVERVDKIMVLADGQIVEFGSREALAGNPASRYSALLRLSADRGPGLTLDEPLERLSE
ncbi:MAG: ABC transporter ATP-binding protein [Acidobacteria bacterium]|nr:ABC transporter ATP-binding protein [Acidobacteriota bacterium]